MVDQAAAADKDVFARLLFEIGDHFLRRLAGEGGRVPCRVFQGLGKNDFGNSVHRPGKIVHGWISGGLLQEGLPELHELIGDATKQDDACLVQLFGIMMMDVIIRVDRGVVTIPVEGHVDAGCYFSHGLEMVDVDAFFSRFKCELLQKGIFDTFEDAYTEIFNYLECYYNSKRRHSALGYLCPDKFEQRYFSNLTKCP